jgi:hypothetical protein
MEIKNRPNNRLLNLKPLNYLADKESFLQYLTGFIEADGCFLSDKTGNQKMPSFNLVQHILDKELFEEIRNFLGIKKDIYINPNNKTYVRILTTTKDDFYLIYELFNGKFITNYRFNQFYDSCKMLNLSPIKGDINNIHPAWFIGFIDGDGCFSVSMSKSNCRTTWKLGQKEPEVLNIFNSYLFNDLLKLSHYQRKTNPLHYHDSIQKIIPNIEELNLLIPYELKTRKSLSLKIFSEIVSMKENNIHLTKDGSDLIISEAKLINSHTPNPQNGYWIGNSKLLNNNWENLLSESTIKEANSYKKLSRITQNSLAYNPYFKSLDMNFTNKKLCQLLSDKGIVNYRTGLPYKESQVARAKLEHTSNL